MALELFHVPYSVTAGGHEARIERVSAPDSARALLWPARSALLARAAAGWLGAKRIPIFASVLSDQAAELILANEEGTWVPVAAVRSGDGEPLGSVWRREDGSVFLPFDPDEVHLNLLSERYRELLLRPGARNWRAAAMRACYRVRRLMPKAVQIWLRRRYAPFQARTAVPEMAGRNWAARLPGLPDLAAAGGRCGTPSAHRELAERRRVGIRRPSRR